MMWNNLRRFFINVKFVAIGCVLFAITPLLWIFGFGGGFIFQLGFAWKAAWKAALKQ